MASTLFLYIFLTAIHSFDSKVKYDLDMFLTSFVRYTHMTLLILQEIVLLLSEISLRLDVHQGVLCDCFSPAEKQTLDTSHSKGMQSMIFEEAYH